MAQDQVNAPIDGQEVAIGDYNYLGSIAGLADDRVFAELLRMPGFDGTNTYATILPYAPNTVVPIGLKPGTVQPSGHADGSVAIYPFRAVVGSRTAVGTIPKQNWWDIRSAVWTSATGASGSVVISPNPAGQPRWDFICATLTIDAPSGNQVRRIKNASSGAIAAALESTVLQTLAGVTTVTGAPSSTPAIPATPVNAALPGGGMIYYVPIAAVRVPSGFTSTSTVLSGDVRDLVPIAPGQSPTMGTGRMWPATGNNDIGGVYATDPAGPGFWNPATGGQRPGVFAPPSWVGKEERIALVDVVTAAHPSHANGAVIDSSIDWRNRIVRVMSVSTSSGGGQKFACDATGSTSRTPLAQQGQFTGAGFGLGITLGSDIQCGNSFVADASLVAGGSTVWSYQGSSTNGINNGAVVGLYVSQSDGLLRWYNNATASNSRWFLWIEATAQFPNY